MDKILKAPLVGLLAVSLVLAVGFSYLTVSKVANAAAVTAFKDVVTDPRPLTSSNHTITLTLGNSVDAGETLTFDFGAGYATSGVDYTDMDVTDDAGELTLAAAPSGATWGIVFAETLTLTSGTGVIATSSVVVIEIGTNAAEGGAGDQQVENPTKSAGVGTADVYDLTVGGTSGNTGTTKIAVIEGVTVSVTIASSLSFSIAGVVDSSCTGDSGSPTAITTTVDTVPFSTVNADAFYAGCQTLTAGTNASDGYSVTAVSNTSLKSAAADLIASGNCDGTCTQSTGSAWATAGNNGFAYYCVNGTGSPCDVAGDTTSEYRNFACAGTVTTNCLPRGSESAVAVMGETAPASSDVGTIHYKLSVDAAQAAGTYSNIVTYVATPTF